MRAYVHRQDERSAALSALGAELVAGDLLDFEAVRSALKGTAELRPGASAVLRPTFIKAVDTVALTKPWNVRWHGKECWSVCRRARPDPTGCPGFSIGSMVAQMIALQGPELVRKLILVGSGPRNGEGIPLTPESQVIFTKKYMNPDDFWLEGFFTESPKSRAQAQRF